MTLVRMTSASSANTTERYGVLYAFMNITCLSAVQPGTACFLWDGRPDRTDTPAKARSTRAKRRFRAAASIRADPFAVDAGQRNGISCQLHRILCASLIVAGTKHCVRRYGHGSRRVGTRHHKGVQNSAARGAAVTVCPSARTEEYTYLHTACAPSTELPDTVSI